ncbi:olfactory receptor 1D5-like [Pseudonaja textilis]|uniref:olfactory receptor 1D5-like n=1 Tax=Pseudonaja textilis TaxID=8673 RepID=UPI000EA8CFBF|nr:olfactory receptor 1D5-like [Pseudonaja textilis]
MSQGPEGKTQMTEFILMGLSDIPAVCFFIILLIYLVTLLGNGTILLAIGTNSQLHNPMFTQHWTGTNSQLHNPMYFFLSNLSLLDIFCPTATVPKMLENLLTENSSISFAGCVLQLYFLVALAGTEVFLLAVMAYDRYVAICNPL